MLWYQELQAKFEETKSALQELETKYSHEVDEWRTKQESFESEISVLKHESKVM